MQSEKSITIERVCKALASGFAEEAKEILRREYPFDPEPSILRRYGPVQSTRVFVRDGFVDRFSGEFLLFPPVLRVLSLEIPDDFPFHPNWRTDVTHPAYWEAGATVDHLVPVTRGGPDNESNWITTSMARNSAKMNWTLDELGWQLHPPGDFRDWDGMLNWFLDYTNKHPHLLSNHSIQKWHRAARLSSKSV